MSLKEQRNISETTARYQSQNTGKLEWLKFGEVVYAIRCMIHENENLNAAEQVDHHILIDWTDRNRQYFFRRENDRLICNGFTLWNRLREILSLFITGIEGEICFSQRESFSITTRPEVGSIRPLRRPRRD